MSETAYQKQYRQEFVAAFEKTEALTRKTVTTESVIKGNEAIFQVVGSGGASAVTRGVNGRIPGRANDHTQYTATLKEWHDKPMITNFNIFASQGDGNRMLQMTTMAVINRKIDEDIRTALATSTLTAGAAATASLALVMKAKAILGLNKIPRDGNLNALISPAFEAYLMQTDEFTSADYINSQPFSNQPEMFRWAGINFIVDPELAGVGTASESCFFYHKSAIGHAVNVGDMENVVGYDQEDAYSYARCSLYMGSKVLQNSGIIKVLHDGSAYVAS